MSVIHSILYRMEGKLEEKHDHHIILLSISRAKTQELEEKGVMDNHYLTFDELARYIRAEIENEEDQDD